MEPAVTQTGVAMAQSEKSGYSYAVQLVGRPRSLLYEFSIRNKSAATIQYGFQEETFSLPPRYKRTHQRCQPATVRFQWPSEQPGSTIQPHDGEPYTVTWNQSGEFQVKSQ